MDHTPVAPDAARPEMEASRLAAWWRRAASCAAPYAAGHDGSARELPTIVPAPVAGLRPRLDRPS